MQYDFGSCAEIWALNVFFSFGQFHWVAELAIRGERWCCEKARSLSQLSVASMSCVSSELGSFWIYKHFDPKLICHKKRKSLEEKDGKTIKTYSRTGYCAIECMPSIRTKNYIHTVQAKIEDFLFCLASYSRQRCRVWVVWGICDLRQGIHIIFGLRALRLGAQVPAFTNTVRHLSHGLYICISRSIGAVWNS